MAKGSNIFNGVQPFPGAGVGKLLIPIETYRTPDPLSPTPLDLRVKDTHPSDRDCRYMKAINDCQEPFSLFYHSMLA